MGETVDSATQTSDDGLDFGPSDPNFLNGSISSPRVEIDTSPPFASVEEAVIRFGGRGFWIPRHILRSSDDTSSVNPEDFDVGKLEEQAAQMLKDLNLKEQETLDVLKELKLTKSLIEQLKLKFPDKSFSSEYSAIPVPCPETNSQISSSKSDSNLIGSSTLPPTSPAGLVMVELRQAKLNLSQSTSELASIRASVESLNMKMEEKKGSLETSRKTQLHQDNGSREEEDLTLQEKKMISDFERARFQTTTSNCPDILGAVNNTTGSRVGISRELRELNFEAEQFMKSAEAAKTEVLKAMSDIEKTKTGLRMIEMRWVAAKKMEEAARAAEELALAEIKALSTDDSAYQPASQHDHDRMISLTFEEYSRLAEKARRAENFLFSNSDLDPLLVQRGQGPEETAEEKLRKMALEELMGKVEVADRRKLGPPEGYRKGFVTADQTRQRRPMAVMDSYNNPDEFRNHSLSQNQHRDSRILNANELSWGNVESHNKPVLRRPTTSIGDILSRKLVLRDELDVGRRGDQSGQGDRQRVSLNQMLRSHRAENSSPLPRREVENSGNGGSTGNDHDHMKHFFSKRIKGLGFVHISLPLSKQSKSKIQGLNHLWR